MQCAVNRWINGPLLTLLVQEAREQALKHHDAAKGAGEGSNLSGRGQSAICLSPHRSGLYLVVVAIIGCPAVVLIQVATLRQPRAASIRELSEIVNLEPT